MFKVIKTMTNNTKESIYLILALISAFSTIMYLLFQESIAQAIKEHQEQIKLNEYNAREETKELKELLELKRQLDLLISESKNAKQQ